MWKIQSLERLNYSQQSLTNDTNQAQGQAKHKHKLKHTKTSSDYNIKPNSTLHLLQSSDSTRTDDWVFRLSIRCDAIIRQKDGTLLSTGDLLPLPKPNPEKTLKTHHGAHSTTRELPRNDLRSTRQATQVLVAQHRNLKTQTAAFGVNPATTHSLKARLQPMLGTNDVIRLYYNGEELGAKPGEDALPLSEYGVDPASSTVYANPQSSQRQVKLPGGKVVVVAAPPADTLSPVDTLAQLPVEDLHVVSNGTPPYGNQTLGEEVVTESFGVTVRIPDGTTVVLHTNPNEPLKSLKARLAKMVSIPVDLQQLYYRDSNDDGSSTGGNNKGGPLDDSKSLQSYNIPKGSKLKLNPGAFQIVVSHVLPSDTFDDLRSNLEKVEGGAPKSKAPLFHLSAGVPNGGGMTLADAIVQPTDTLYLDPKQFNVDVRGADGKTFPLKVTPADSIHTLRTKLGKMHGIPPEEQHFVYDSTALCSDPRTTLDDYGVQPGAVMDLTHGASVAVRTPDGRVITLDYEPEEMVASLKQRVQTFDGRVPEPDEEVRLLFNGKVLDDLHPLANYELVTLTLTL
jgi:hypothetical protein